jgi:hypothetical protein
VKDGAGEAQRKKRRALGNQENSRRGRIIGRTPEEHDRPNSREARFASHARCLLVHRSRSGVHFFYADEAR